MSNIYKVNIIYLILYLRFGELNSKSIIGHRQDKAIYDNVNDDFTAIYEFEIDIYNISTIYEPLFTGVSLEQPIMPAQLIETTTRSMAASKDYYNYKNINNILLNQSMTSEDSSSTDQTTTEMGDVIINTDELDSLLMKYEEYDGTLCLLDGLKRSFLWWTFSNGTLKVDKLNKVAMKPYLDFSHHNISDDDQLYEEFQTKASPQLRAFSVAYNKLTKVPQRTLVYLANSLKYLSLAGNQFVAQSEINTRLYNEPITVERSAIHCDENPHYADNHNDNSNSKSKIFSTKNQQDTEWAAFPYLPNLIELDISHCQIEYITKRVFENLTNLERLYMSHNKILNIPYESFSNTPSLEFLDLSFTNFLEIDDKPPLPNLDAILSYALNIEQATFKYLPNLQYLDLSHTRITKCSAVAFTHLGERLEFLSLCYTSFPMFVNAIFQNTSLVGLDLSGNLVAGYNILDDVFDGIADSLKYLYFERANLRDLSWLRNLQNLRILGLADNNINALALERLSSLVNLQLLDLSSNQVGNWYKRVFSHNENLRVLSLRDNNLNIITSEMIKDFSLLEYLSLGDNDFVCNCLLRQLVNLAKENNTNDKCRRNAFKGLQEVIKDAHEINKSDFKDNISQMNISDVILKQHLKKLQSGSWNLRKLNETRKRLKMRFGNENPTSCIISSTAATEILDQQNGTFLKFQLLDYQDEHYYCFNETEKLQFVELNCQQQPYSQDIAEELNTLTTYIVICLASIVGVSLIGFLIYWKRWYIHYYYCSFKTASLMSAAAKENSNKLKGLSDNDPNMIYDVFISYCQNDRDWILEQLMPNIEEAGDISICLHERDFQIGVTILDNIVSCMDRSRALMLIISADFLLSHWCQFEMHLAQHRIFDVRQNHLILVFLEDIPRSKRPKHLQYLMDVKTYVRWPGGKEAKGKRLEERKLFWKRLKCSLANIGINTVESKA